MSDLRTRVNRYVDELSPPSAGPFPAPVAVDRARPSSRGVWPIAAAVVVTAAVVVAISVVIPNLLSTSHTVATSPSDLVGSWTISGVGDQYSQPLPPTSNRFQPVLTFAGDGGWTVRLECSPSTRIEGTWSLQTSGTVAMSSAAVPDSCRDDPSLQTMLSTALTPQPEAPILRLNSSEGTVLTLAPVPGLDDAVAVITDYGNGHGYISLTMPVGRHCGERVTQVDNTGSAELTVVVDLDARVCPGPEVTAEFGHALRTLPDPGLPTTVHLDVESNDPVEIAAAWNPR